jgi:hypothetical protein
VRATASHGRSKDKLEMVRTVDVECKEEARSELTEGETRAWKQP